MSPDLLRFWKYFPRLALSAAFVVNMFTLILNPREIIAWVETFVPLMYAQVGGFFAGIVLVVTLITCAALGSLLLDILISLVAGIVRAPIAATTRSGLLARPAARVLLQPASALAFQMFLQDREQIMACFRLKGLCDPQTVTHRKELHELSEDVAQHMSEIGNEDLATDLAYFSGITQEQRLEEHFKLAVSDIYYLWFVIALVVLVIARSSQNWLTGLSGVGVGLMLILLSLPALSGRKRQLAKYLLHSYLDNFTFAEGAAVSDRDAV